MGSHRGSHVEITGSGSQPSGLADFISDHRKDLLVFVTFNQLLCVGLWGARRESGAALRLSTELCLELLFRPLGLPGGAIGPDGQISGHLAGVPVPKTGRDGTRIDEKIELDTSKEGNPVSPLNTSSLAGVIDGTRWESMGGKGKASTAGTAERLGWDPRWCELSSEVLLKGKLEFDDGCRGIPGGERASEVGDGLSKSDSEGSGSGGRGHCDNDRMWR